MTAPKKKASIIKSLWPYLAPYKWQLLLVLGLLFIGTPLALFHPLVWQYVVDGVIEQQDGSKLITALVVMTVVHLVSVVTMAFQNSDGKNNAVSVRMSAFCSMEQQKVTITKPKQVKTTATEEAMTREKSNHISLASNFSSRQRLNGKMDQPATKKLVCHLLTFVSSWLHQDCQHQ